MKEIWKDVEGYEGIYEVSNYGKIKTLKRISGTCHRKDKELSINRLTKDGYIHVALAKGDRIKEDRLHQVVARHFVENTENKPTVNHIDGNKLNNRADNLEWSTRHEQLQHAYNLGLKKPKMGTDNYASKLTEADVRYIRKHYKRQSTEFGTVALSKRFNVSNRVIGLVARGLTYKNVK